MISVTAAPVIGVAPFRNALSTKARVVGVESLVGDDVTELLVAPDFDEATPVFFDVRVEGLRSTNARIRSRLLRSETLESMARRIFASARSVPSPRSSRYCSTSIRM